MASLVWRTGRLAVAACLVSALAGCEVAVGGLQARAQDEWVRTYTLPSGGGLTIGNTNGRIDVEGTEASTVEVKATRIVKATSDAGAKELLERVVINEAVNPDGVAIETARIGGVLIGANVEVQYHVTVPKRTPVRVRTTNGAVIVVAVGGAVEATTTNGAVTVRESTGAVVATTTNGAVQVQPATLDAGGIKARTTNGGVRLILPDDAKADIDATVTNGGIDAAGLNIESSESSRRHLKGRLNGGGAPVEITTTNGGIRIRNRSQARTET